MDPLSLHYAAILQLPSPWKVTSVDLAVDLQRVTIEVDFDPAASWTCPECKGPAVFHDRRESREWRHLSVMQFETRLRCRVARCSCPEHGIKTVHVPWAEPQGRFTLMFEAFAIQVLKACKTIEQAASLLRIDWHTAQEILERAVIRGLARRELSDLPHLGLDEKAFRKGVVTTVLTDIEGSRVLDVVLGCDAKAGIAAVETVPEGKRKEVLAVAIDMSPSYIKAVETALPWADIVFDHFHVTKLLNDAMESTRRQEAALAPSPDRPSLKRSRFLWLKHPEDLSESQLERFAPIRDSNLKVAKVYAAKETFRSFWRRKSFEGAWRFFRQWAKWCRAQKIAALTRAVTTLEARYLGLENALFHGISNAKAEAHNGMIQSLKAAARGFRSFTNYRLVILFHQGKLALQP